MRAEALACPRCDLASTRTQVVFGEGDPHARILLIGEGPGADENATGRPFVGRAGKLLDLVLENAGLKRDELYITNVVRCRPTSVKDGLISNRAPRAGEVRACEVWRSAEIELVDPKVVVCVGAPAAKTLISRDFKITEQRGRLVPREDGRTYIATLHPAYLLRLANADRNAYVRVRAEVVDDLRAAASAASGTEV